VHLCRSAGGWVGECGSIGTVQRQEDWYAYLGLTRQAPEERIAQAVERLSRQATALAVTAPERSQRLRDTIRLIKRDLLSGLENRQRYDVALAAAAAAPGPLGPQAAPVPVAPAPAFGGEGVGSRIARFLRTGWTCAACGKEALPSDRFCTKCGTPIKPVQIEAGPKSTRAACVNCGSVLAANDVFCSRCGTRAHTER
jgi:Double zinc ribbon